MSTPTAVRRIAASAAGALAVLVAVVLLAVPAAAHATMTGTSPEDGASVTEQLDTVVLEFSEPVGFAQVQMTGPDGEPVEGGAPVEQGSIVELPLPPELEPGVYTVEFRVTSDDGHPIAERFAFAYEGPVAESEGREGDESAEVAGSSPDSQEAGDPQPARDAQEARSPQQARDGGPGGLVLVGALVALVGFAAAAVFAARREAVKETDADEPGPGDGDDARA